MRRAVILAPAAVALLGLLAATRAGPPEPDLAAIGRTRALLGERLAARDAELRTRVRVLYKLVRAGHAPLWVDERARGLVVRWRAAARRMILRDLDERRVLVAELAAVEADERRLARTGDEARRAAAAPLAPGSLGRPAPGRIVGAFGVERDGPTRARVARRGIELAAAPGERAVAVAPGTVAYAGPVRGLGVAVLVDHGGGVHSVTGGLASASVDAGRRVARGDALGEALGAAIYLELRLAGRPIDPTSLLEPRRR